MKAKKIIILLALYIAPALMFGQTNSPFPPQHSQLRNEIGISAGPLSGFSSLIIAVSASLIIPPSAISGKGFDIQNYGSYGLHYYHQIKPWLQVGGKISAEAFSYLNYTDTTLSVLAKKENFIFLNITPSVRFTYLNRPWVRLYSGIDLGLGMILGRYQNSNNTNETSSEDTKNNPFYPAVNITPIGISVGKGFFGMLETNIGTDSFIKIGIGARW